MSSAWTQFKLIVTEPANYTEHFGLIKNELIPFVEENALSFWITNYFNVAEDFILFRAKHLPSQIETIEDFLNDLKQRNLIVDWQVSSWSPGVDAQARINDLKRCGFDPSSHIIIGFNGTNVLICSDRNIQERQQQLTSLFEALGECTKVIYKHLENKPKDLWIMSVFIHLLLNSIDYSGPNPSSEEDCIRRIPPL